MTRMERLGAEDEALLRRLYPTLVRFGAVVAGREVEPEDLVQEAVCRALRVHALSELENPGAYLRQAMVGIASNQRKRRDLWDRFVSRSRVRSTVTPAFPSDLDDLLRLSPKTRAILYLTVVEEVTLAEAAAIVGCSESAARARSSRGLRRLRLELEEESRRE
jgi:RNA polymerase sigma factor (sigma-70 family)